jgi:hypothetical protein
MLSPIMMNKTFLKLVEQLFHLFLQPFKDINGISHWSSSSVAVAISSWSNLSLADAIGHTAVTAIQFMELSLVQLLYF